MLVSCSLRRTIALIILAAFSLGIGPLAKAQSGDDLKTLNQRLVRLYQAGKYAEATKIAKRALALAQRQFGPSHAEVAVALNNLAELYLAEGHYGEAEPLYKRALAIAEKALGPDHPHVGTCLDNLAELYRDEGRYAEAEPLYKRALAIAEKAFGPDHPDVGTDLHNLANLYREQGRYAEAVESLPG